MRDDCGVLDHSMVWMGAISIMNKWDKVEKTKRTQHDITTEYIKLVLYVLGGMAYFYFIIMGWTI